MRIPVVTIISLSHPYTQSMTLSLEAQPALSDGRRIRALPERFTQPQMFSLILPRQESIMCVKDLDDACNASGGWSDPYTGRWRSGRYGVHARAFELLDRQIGASVVWTESGLSYIFEMPDVRHPTDRSRGLRDACGLIEFPLPKLCYDDGGRKVSVTADFDPEKDVAVRDVRRIRGWALQNAEGYPSRSMPSDASVPQARFSGFFSANEFEAGSNGWHGSIIYGDAGQNDWRMIGAGRWESESAVGLVIHSGIRPSR